MNMKQIDTDLQRNSNLYMKMCNNCCSRKNVDATMKIFARIAHSMSSTFIKKNDKITIIFRLYEKAERKSVHSYSCQQYFFRLQTRQLINDINFLKLLNCILISINSL